MGQVANLPVSPHFWQIGDLPHGKPPCCATERGYERFLRTARLNVEKVQGYRLSEIVATYRQRNELPSYILAVDWFEQAFRALAAIHATGRMHRSIGLEKIFVGADDEVRIEEGGAASDFARGWAPAGGGDRPARRPSSSPAARSISGPTFTAWGPRSMNS